METETFSCRDRDVELFYTTRSRSQEVRDGTTFLLSSTANTDLPGGSYSTNGLLWIVETRRSVPLQVYPEFVLVSQQMSMMEPIYVLFEQQMASRALWGETLWKDLNVLLLQDGIDGYLAKARKLPKPIRALSVWLSSSYTLQRSVLRPC